MENISLRSIAGCRSATGPLTIMSAAYATEGYSSRRLRKDTITTVFNKI